MSGAKRLTVHPAMSPRYYGYVIEGFGETFGWRLRGRVMPVDFIDGRHIYLVDGSEEAIRDAVVLIAKDHEYRATLERNAENIGKPISHVPAGPPNRINERTILSNRLGIDTEDALEAVGAA